MSLAKAISILCALCPATAVRKCTAWILPIAAAIILSSNPANAQTAFSFSFSGNGTNSGGNFSLAGSGNITPYGATTISVTGTAAGSGSIVVALWLHSATEAPGSQPRL